MRKENLTSQEKELPDPVRAVFAPGTEGEVEDDVLRFRRSLTANPKSPVW